MCLDLLLPIQLPFGFFKEVRVRAQLSETLGGEYIIKAATKGEILIPPTLHKGGDNPVLCLINLSDPHVELERGKGPRRFLLRINVSLGLLGMGRQYTHSSTFPFLLYS
jgi:hypothetical protein